MNHGYCKNCWWLEESSQEFTIVTANGLKKFPCEGLCWMHGGMVNGDSYCPDYYDREYGNIESKMTLQEWIDKNKLR